MQRDELQAKKRRGRVREERERKIERDRQTDRKGRGNAYKK